MPHRAAWYASVANSNNGSQFEVGGASEEAGNTKAAEEKRLQRRRSGGGGTAVVGSPDLLTIPGVGPRNLRKLVEKGFDEVAQLKQLYKDKVGGV